MQQWDLVSVRRERCEKKTCKLGGNIRRGRGVVAVLYLLRR